MQLRSLARAGALMMVLALVLSIAGGVFAAPLGNTAPAPVSAPQSQESNALARLQADAGGSATVNFATQTGVARFLSLTAPLSTLDASAAPEAQAAVFFDQYGQVFGVTDAASELSLVRQTTDATGATLLVYAQVYQGLPVFAGELRVHFAPAGWLRVVNGYFVPGITVGAAPAVSAAAADATAVAHVGKAGTTARANTLLVFRTGLAQGVQGTNHLAYRVEVGNGSTVREFVFVDAHSGKVLDQVSGIHEDDAPTALNRQISETSLANVVWTNPPDPEPIPAGWAGGTAQQVTDWNDEAAGSKETYYLFSSMAGRDSYDNNGATMRTVNNDPGIACPNANWNGISTNYCTGVTSDDVVSHEWGHAYTEYTSNLIYQWQSGALNESYSDIWGETADLLNGRGTDTPGPVRTSNVNACSLHTVPPAVLTVNAPPVIAGNYRAQAAAFGAPLTTPVTGDVALADDGVGHPGQPANGSDPTTTDACEPLVNGAQIAGKIALVYRGTCAFTVKVLNAQNAGAIGVIVGNYVSGGFGLPGMGGANASITIPSLGVDYFTADAVDDQLANGVVNVTLGLLSVVTDDSYRWLMGEDSSAFGGAIRDMWNPLCYADPGKVSDQFYYCDVSDGGGVHTNSGVPNHAFALMTDGGTFNGQTITGLGLTKAAHIHWRAQSTYLGPASGFPDHADALAQSCQDLIGVNLFALSTSSGSQVPSGQVISAADCTEVNEVIAAVEFNLPPTQCNFQPILQPNAPPLCTSGSANDIFLDNFETGPGLPGWTLTNQGVYAGWTPRDWVRNTSLPGSRPGAAAYGIDPFGGQCDGSPADESSVMRMESPLIVIPGGAAPKLAFDHYVATEFGYDGGNLEISVDGGAYTLVPAAAYTFNAYNTTLITAGGGNTNPIAGQAAFSGTDGGVVGGSWGQSQIDLAALGVTPGSTVRLRYNMGTDGCAGVDGWYVDDVRVYTCGGPTAVSLSALETSETPTMATTWLAVAGIAVLGAAAVILRRRARA